MMVEKIVYQSTRAGSINFPPRKTCEFATEKCLKECILQSNSFEEATFRYFIGHSSEHIAKQIAEELNRYSYQVLSWFPEAGDCPIELTEKILKAMEILSKENYIQCGFTRNSLLWSQSHIIPNTRLALSVENEKEAYNKSADGLVSLPDYKTWQVKLLYHATDLCLCGNGFIIPLCGMGFVQTEEESTEEDCGLCYEKKVGCFAFELKETENGL